MRGLRSRARALCLTIVATSMAACVRPPAGIGPFPSPGDQRRDLRFVIDTLVGAAEFRNAHWGVLIVDPETSDTLYAHNSAKLFIPASNQKLVTGAVALTLLGPDYRFRTLFRARGARRDSTLQGDLVIDGRGDPTASDQIRGDAMLAMLEIADSVYARGIRRIDGRVVPGADVFTGPLYGYGWSWDDFGEPYSAGVDELLFNEGFARVMVRAGAAPGDGVTAEVRPSRVYPPLVVQARTVIRPDTTSADTVPPPRPRVRAERDSVGGRLIIVGELAVGDSQQIRVAHPDPRAAYVAALVEALAARGIAVTGRVLPDSGRADSLFTVQSIPLRDIMPAFEKPSQNQIGEVLLRALGLEIRGVGSADSGRFVIETQLQAWGVSRDGFVVRDGSGLSRYNYLSPETVVRVLDVMRRDPVLFPIFYAALPVAGVDGTIASRMRGTPAEGNAHAKTGFVAHARSLSGYVRTADGRLLLFSLLCNNWTVPVRSVERVQDAIVARLAGMSVGRSIAAGADDR